MIDPTQILARFLRSYEAMVSAGCYIDDARNEIEAESLLLEVNADPQPVRYQRHWLKLGGNAKTHFLTGRGLDAPSFA